MTAAISEPPIWILSLCGGGVRTYAQLQFIDEIERRTGLAVSQLFDLIAGTSGGGYAALSLGTPHPENHNLPKWSARDLLNYFPIDGEKMGAPQSWWARALSWIWPSYSSSQRKEFFSGKFGDTKVAEALTDVLVPIVDLKTMESHLISRTDCLGENPHLNRLKMCDLTEAAVSIPGTCEAKKIQLTDEKEIFGIDGGIGPYDPAYPTYRKAREIYGSERKIKVLSLGSGFTPDSGITHEDTKEKGMVFLVSKLVNNFFRAQMQLSNAFLREDLGEDYTLIQFEITHEQLANSGDCSRANLDLLTGSVASWLREPANEEMLQSYCDELLATSMQRKG